MSIDIEQYRIAVEKTLEKNIFYHSLALQACMEGLYDHFEKENNLGAECPTKEEWSLAGLIHDIDYAGEFKGLHPQRTVEALSIYDLTISKTVHDIVKAHAPSITGYQPTNKAEWSIFCADSLTGLIVAVALVYPTKKLAEVKVSSVLKRFLKEPKFAAGTRRNEVAMCTREDGLNTPLDKFIEICLISMQDIASTIGL